MQSAQTPLAWLVSTLAIHYTSLPSCKWKFETEGNRKKDGVVENLAQQWDIYMENEYSDSKECLFSESLFVCTAALKKARTLLCIQIRKLLRTQTF